METDTPPRTDLCDPEKDLQAWRDVAVHAARESGARILAVGTSPTEVASLAHRNDRYKLIMENSVPPRRSS